MERISWANIRIPIKPSVFSTVFPMSLSPGWVWFNVAAAGCDLGAQHLRKATHPTQRGESKPRWWRFAAFRVVVEWWWMGIPWRTQNGELVSPPKENWGGCGYLFPFEIGLYMYGACKSGWSGELQKWYLGAHPLLQVVVGNQVFTWPKGGVEKH